MTAALARFFLAVGAGSLRKAARLLQRSSKLRRLEPGDQQTLSSLNREVGEGVGEMLRVIRKVQGASTGDRALAGFTFFLADAAAGRPQVIVFDLVDGSHCYYIDPPGVCCCDPC